MLSYTSTLKELLSLSKIRKNHTSLESIKQVCATFDNPEKTFPSVHVAGTNGKGSTCIKIARALQEEYKTGLYTSPHISSFRERIQINGEVISEESFSSLFTKIQSSFPSLTLFEMTTAIAFLYFKEQKVDIAVIETGLGGRLDPTNVCSPILSILTSIGYDHTDLLGSSLEKIAYEKAGIIKEKVPVLLGPHIQKALIEKTASSLHAPLYQNTKKEEDYEKENRETARHALKLLEPLFPISKTSLEKGLLQNPPCRFEVFQKDHIVILDVAHNPEGFISLLKKLEVAYKDQDYRFLLAFSKGKEIGKCAELVKEYKVHLLRDSNPYLEEAEKILPLFSPSTTIEKSVENVLKKAAQNNEILIIAGSFFIMEKARKALGLKTIS